ncbi:mixed lineage kinase domain-like protein [Saccoglossus kowalevskii]|uniref:Mixed lineage kinase domain-like protein-like n=1 Tax=Saccoglossus kowalevskii TaxID=10224 RepID=A0ABM0MRL9_SACKO|nr:PREDICTED: mixed lineage kinase domain-like protein-like [Saccoglossus kowalevskii]
MADTALQVFQVASQIYDIVQEVNANKERCRRFATRVRCLVEPLQGVRKLNNADKVNYERALTQLEICLRESKMFLVKFRDVGTIKKILKREDYKSEFTNFNERLDGLASALSLGLEAATKARIDEVFEQQRILQEDRKDEELDRQQIIVLLDDISEGQQKIGDELDSGFQSLGDKLDDYQKSVKTDQQEIKDDMKVINKKLDDIQLRTKTENDRAISQPSDELKIIESGELENRELIGEGRFGKVYKAVYNKHDVAVKKFIEKSPGPLLAKNLRDEAEKMKKFNAKNVVRLYGICTETDSHLLVMEYMSEKDLRGVLNNPSRYNLTWRRRLRMAFEGACGLYRIHNAKPPMLHRSISSIKFLVNEDLHIKITGCGFSLTRSSARRHKSSPKKTTLQYIAPEHLFDVNTIYTDKSETYSYGIVMWEIATSKKPFEGMTDSEVVRYVSNERRKEAIEDSDCPDEFGDLIDKCRDFDPFNRPFFKGEFIFIKPSVNLNDRSHEWNNHLNRDVSRYSIGQTFSSRNCGHVVKYIKEIQLRNMQMLSSTEDPCPRINCTR